MDHIFQVHILNDEGIKKAKRIANAFDDCLEVLHEMCPINSREFSIVRTKLEEACFFAKKSMANVPENQKTTTT